MKIRNKYFRLYYVAARIRVGFAVAVAIAQIKGFVRNLPVGG